MGYEQPDSSFNLLESLALGGLVTVGTVAGISSIKRRYLDRKNELTEMMSSLKTDPAHAAKVGYKQKTIFSSLSKTNLPAHELDFHLLSNFTGRQPVSIAPGQRISQASGDLIDQWAQTAINNNPLFAKQGIRYAGLNVRQGKMTLLAGTTPFELPLVDLERNVTVKGLGRTSKIGNVFRSGSTAYVAPFRINLGSADIGDIQTFARKVGMALDPKDLSNISGEIVETLAQGIENSTKIKNIIERTQAQMVNPNRGDYLKNYYTGYFDVMTDALESLSKEHSGTDLVEKVIERAKEYAQPRASTSTREKNALTYFGAFVGSDTVSVNSVPIARQVENISVPAVPAFQEALQKELFRIHGKTLPSTTIIDMANRAGAAFFTEIAGANVESLALGKVNAGELAKGVLNLRKLKDVSRVQLGDGTIVSLPGLSSFVEGGKDIYHQASAYREILGTPSNKFGGIFDNPMRGLSGSEASRLVPVVDITEESLQWQQRQILQSKGMISMGSEGQFAYMGNPNLRAIERSPKQLAGGHISTEQIQWAIEHSPIDQSIAAQVGKKLPTGKSNLQAGRFNSDGRFISVGHTELDSLSRQHFNKGFAADSTIADLLELQRNLQAKGDNIILRANQSIRAVSRDFGMLNGEQKYQDLNNIMVKRNHFIMGSRVVQDKDSYNVIIDRGKYKHIRNSAMILGDKGQTAVQLPHYFDAGMATLFPEGVFLNVGGDAGTAHSRLEGLFNKYFVLDKHRTNEVASFLDKTLVSHYDTIEKYGFAATSKMIYNKIIAKDSPLRASSPEYVKNVQTEFKKFGLVKSIYGNKENVFHHTRYIPGGNRIINLDEAKTLSRKSFGTQDIATFLSSGRRQLVERHNFLKMVTQVDKKQALLRSYVDYHLTDSISDSMANIAEKLTLLPGGDAKLTENVRNLIIAYDQLDKAPSGTGLKNFVNSWKTTFTSNLSTLEILSEADSLYISGLKNNLTSILIPALDDLGFTTELGPGSVFKTGPLVPLMKTLRSVISGKSVDVKANAENYIRRLAGHSTQKAVNLAIETPFTNKSAGMRALWIPGVRAHDITTAKDMYTVRIGRHRALSLVEDTTTSPGKLLLNLEDKEQQRWIRRFLRRRKNATGVRDAFFKGQDLVPDLFDKIDAMFANTSSRNVLRETLLENKGLSGRLFKTLTEDQNIPLLEKFLGEFSHNMIRFPNIFSSSTIPIKIAVDRLMKKGDISGISIPTPLFTLLGGDTDWDQVKILSDALFTEEDGFITRLVSGSNRAQLPFMKEEKKFRTMATRWLAASVGLDINNKDYTSEIKLRDAVLKNYQKSGIDEVMVNLNKADISSYTKDKKIRQRMYEAFRKYHQSVKDGDTVAANAFKVTLNKLMADRSSQHVLTGITSNKLEIAKIALGKTAKDLLNTSNAYTENQVYLLTNLLGGFSEMTIQKGGKLGETAAGESIKDIGTRISNALIDGGLNLADMKTFLEQDSAQIGKVFRVKGAQGTSLESVFNTFLGNDGNIMDLIKATYQGYIQGESSGESSQFVRNLTGIKAIYEGDKKSLYSLLKNMDFSGTSKEELSILADALTSQAYSQMDDPVMNTLYSAFMSGENVAYAHTPHIQTSKLPKINAGPSNNLKKTLIDFFVNTETKKPTTAGWVGLAAMSVLGVGALMNNAEDPHVKYQPVPQLPQYNRVPTPPPNLNYGGPAGIVETPDHMSRTNSYGSKPLTFSTRLQPSIPIPNSRID